MQILCDSFPILLQRFLHETNGKQTIPLAFFLSYEKNVTDYVAYPKAIIYGKQLSMHMSVGNQNHNTGYNVNYYHVQESLKQNTFLFLTFEE